MKILEKRGPDIDPCGTPDSTLLYSLNEESISRLWIRLFLLLNYMSFVVNNFFYNNINITTSCTSLHSISFYKNVFLQKQQHFISQDLNRQKTINCFLKCIKNKSIVTFDLYRNFAYVSSPFQNKIYAWKRLCGISLTL